MSNVHRRKREARIGRHRRVRKSVYGTAEQPRLTIFRSLGHIYAQIVDDSVSRTLVSASSLKIDLGAEGDEGGIEGKEGIESKESKEGKKGKEGKEGKKGKKRKPDSIKMKRSRAVGRELAEKALAKGIKKVAFDRGGYLYHGRVAELAEAARKAGLEF